MLDLQPPTRRAPRPADALDGRRPTFRAVVETVVPAAAGLDAAAWRELEGVVLAALAARPPAVRAGVRLLLLGLDGLSRVAHGAAFADLPPAARERVLRRLESSVVQPLRVGCWGLRTLAFMGYYGRPQAAAALGWRPDVRGWEAHG